jgi:nitric oxide reductase NorE protein
MSPNRRIHTPNQNAFYLYYFILTGLHLFHVFIGIVVLVLLLTQAGKPDLSVNRMAFVEGGACFWHLVDLLWIVLFPLLYLVS